MEETFDREIVGHEKIRKYAESELEKNEKRMAKMKKEIHSLNSAYNSLDESYEHTIESYKDDIARLQDKLNAVSLKLKNVRAMICRVISWKCAAEEATECQLGLDTRVFAGVTLVSDYVAHPHKDASDFPKGVIGLFSFQNDSIAAQAQMHILVNYSLKLFGHSF